MVGRVIKGRDKCLYLIPENLDAGKVTRLGQGGADWNGEAGVQRSSCAETGMGERLSAMP